MEKYRVHNIKSTRKRKRERETEKERERGKKRKKKERKGESVYLCERDGERERRGTP